MVIKRKLGGFIYIRQNRLQTLRKNEARSIRHPDFKLCHKAIAIKTV